MFEIIEYNQLPSLGEWENCEWEWDGKENKESRILIWQAQDRGPQEHYLHS